MKARHQLPLFMVATYLCLKIIAVLSGKVYSMHVSGLLQLHGHELGQQWYLICAVQNSLYFGSSSLAAPSLQSPFQATYGFAGRLSTTLFAMTLTC
jgi:hypothetical protein